MVSIPVLAGSALLIVLLAASIRVIGQYERVIFRLGKIKERESSRPLRPHPLVDKMVGWT